MYIYRFAIGAECIRGELAEERDLSGNRVSLECDFNSCRGGFVGCIAFGSPKKSYFLEVVRLIPRDTHAARVLFTLANYRYPLGAFAHENTLFDPVCLRITLGFRRVEGCQVVTCSIFVASLYSISNGLAEPLVIFTGIFCLFCRLGERGRFCTLVF